MEVHAAGGGVGGVTFAGKTACATMIEASARNAGTANGRNASPNPFEVRDGRYHQQRTEHRTGLIHRRMQAEPPAVSDLSRCRGKEDVARWSAHRLAGALDHQ